MSDAIADLTGEAETQIGPSEDDSNLADEIAVESLKHEATMGHVAHDYLQKRMRLLDLQIRHFDEDISLRRIGERLRITIQLLFILAGVVIVIALAGLVWSAAHSRSVVIEEFDTPPSLAQQGETGRVVAGAVLDELTKLQAATRSAAAKRNLANAWAGDIKIDIPDTGISVGELERTLRARLGDDIHIGGSVVRSDDGSLALTVRGDGVLPKTFAGGKSDAAKLARTAAEYVYGEAEPLLYADYLDDAGRYADGEKFLAQAYPRAAEADRPPLALEWGNILSSENRLPEASEKYRLAVMLRPRYWAAWGNLIGSLATPNGGEEAAWHAGEEMAAKAKDAPANDRPNQDHYANWYPLVQDWTAVRGGSEWELRFNNGAGESPETLGPLLADASAMLHDWASAAKYQAASSATDPLAIAKAQLLKAYRALDRNDYAAAISPLENFYKQWLANTDVQFSDNDQPCYLGYAYGMVGRLADAEAVFRRTGRWVRCAAMRADVIEHTGDWRKAIVAYRSAIALAPDLPLAYDRWGLALERHGDLNGAAGAFRAASQRGPHWAEPLKHWGDVLMREHEPQAALQKYEEAIAYAPQWDALNAARTRAAGSR